MVDPSNEIAFSFPAMSDGHTDFSKVDLKLGKTGVCTSETLSRLAMPGQRMFSNTVWLYYRGFCLFR